MASRILSLLFLSASLLSDPLEKDFLLQNQYDPQHFHSLQLSSLLPSSTCTRSSTVGDHNSSLEVIHKYGPCSNLNHDNLSISDLAEQIFQQDRLRAERIHSLLYPKKSVGSNDNRRFQQEVGATTLPVQDTSVLGDYGTYFVKVGLGTPKKSLSLHIDSGSDLTWTQCKPCTTCYQQVDPIFDPAASSSYSYEPCTTAYCSFVAIPQQPTCSSSGICVYRASYEDTSTSEGYLSKDTLTLSSSDVNPGFLFGCGHKNVVIFSGEAGMMGLGRGMSSVVEQTAAKHKRLFSSCLPSTSSSSGYLIFGSSSPNAVYTPMIRFPPVPAQSLYGVKLLAITVGGVLLPVSVKTATVVDSGATFTLVPPVFYGLMKAAFRNQMARYTLAPAWGELDTCYDIRSSGGSVVIPKISFTFDGGAVVDLLPGNIMTPGPYPWHICLTFYAGTAPDVNILGNTMQKGFEVVHDINGARIGFVPNAC